MNTAQLSQTLLASWRQRDRSSPWGRWLIAALVVLPSAASLAFLEGPMRWGIAVAVVLLVIHIGWMVVSANLQVQNDPAAARFVPGHVRALQEAALLGWVLCTAASTLLMWLVVPAPFLSWQALLLGNAAAAVFSLWSSRFWWLWFMAVFWAPLLGAFGETVRAPLQAAQPLWAGHTDVLLVVGLLLLSTLVPAVFGHGDDRHRRSHDRLRRMQEVQRMFQEGRQATPVQAFASLERFSSPFVAAISAWRRHVLRTADNRRLGSVMARAELVLHANQHWTYQLLTAASLVVGLALTFAVVIAWTSVPLAEMVKHGAFGMSIGLASMAVNPTLARPMLWQTRREQALLRLLPAMPQGSALNRAVAWIALRHALLAALLASLVIIPLCAATSQWGLLWLPVMAVPWSVRTATRSPASMRPPTGLTSALPVLAFYLCAGLAYVGTERLGLPMTPLALGLLAATAAWGAYRWRQLARQPAALPAGRLA